MAKDYRCFFCDEIFKTRAEAYEHFGDTSTCGSDIPACVDPLRADEKEQMKELREARRIAMEGMHHEERAEFFAWELSRVEEELERYFGKGCRTTWQAGDRYSNLEFELKMAREEIEALKNRASVEVANG